MKGGKKGTTAATAAVMKTKAGKVSHGASVKNVVTTGRKAGRPSTGRLTRVIKGSDRGGV